MDKETILLILAVLGGISEALSLIPSVKANGLFQLLCQVLKTCQGKKSD